MGTNRLSLLPLLLLLSLPLFAQTEQELVGEWTMTRMKSTFHDKFGRVNNVKKNCEGCEIFQFNADHTYTWSNQAINETGEWRMPEEGRLQLSGRTRAGEAADDELLYVRYRKEVLTIGRSETDRFFVRK